MSIAVELPSLGESVFEGTVARWLVSEGEMVEVDQPIVEVTTDKVDAEIPAPCAGRIEQILVAEGEVVEIGAVLARIDTDAKADTAIGNASATQPVPTSSSKSEPNPIAATPVARRMADEASIDLRQVQGTGSAGRITKEDVLRHDAGTPSPASAELSGGQNVSSQPGRAAPLMTPPVAPPMAPPVARPAASTPTPTSAPRKRPAPSFAYELQEGDRVIPMSPMRRIISDHMVYSKRTSPHVGTVGELDLSAVVRLRNQHKKAFQETYGLPLTFLPFVVHAVVRALREFPALNASVVEDAIIEKQNVHVGVAIETEKGLVVPVIRDADRLSLAGTAMAIHDLSNRARNKKLSADDLRGGTFTVSNPGRHGNLYGFAIINQPQVGILRMGEIAKRPVVRSLEGEDAIVIRTMMYLALSYDHRAVDGAPANGFLHRIRELLETADFDL